MKNKNLLILLFFAILPFLFTNCTDDPPEANISAIEVFSNNAITFSFSDNSSNSPTEWFWTFEGGIPATSTEQNPIVTYTETGTFNVSLVVKNGDGEDAVTFYEYINIIEFYNPLFTDIYVTINGETKSMVPNEFLRFAQTNDYTFSYYADTYGETTDGTIVGEEIYWDETLSVLQYSSYDLVLSSDFIYLYINNGSNYDYYPIYVNWGTSYETEDNVWIPADNKTYGLGYYFAFNNMEIRAYLEDSFTDFNSWNVFPPWEENQYMELVYKKSTKGNSIREKSERQEEPKQVQPKKVLKDRIGRKQGAQKRYQTNMK